MIETISLFGKDISLFFIFWFLAMVVGLIVGLLLRKEYYLSASKCIIYISLDLCIGLLLLIITSKLFGTGNTAGLKFVRIVNFCWIYFLLLAYFLKDPYENILDLLTIKGAFFYAIAHIGCIFPGCCHGYASDWGIYSNNAGYVCFPIQLVECTINIMIGFILLAMRKNKKFHGQLNPWYMIMFGATRFVTEFLRDNDKLFWGISELAIHALVSFILGSVAIIIINQRKEKMYQNEKNQ